LLNSTALAFTIIPNIGTLLLNFIGTTCTNPCLCNCFHKVQYSSFATQHCVLWKLQVSASVLLSSSHILFLLELHTGRINQFLICHY
jgi:hypothetical protein